MPKLTQKIRILHCIETISSGGVERVRLNYARKMSKDLFELKIVCTQAKGETLKELESLGIEVIQVGIFKHPFQISNYKRLLKVVRDYKPHIIHGAVFEGNSMAFVGKVFGKVPIAILEETSEPKFRSSKANLLLKVYGFFAEAFIGISPAVIEYLHLNLKIPGKKVYLIPNGVEIPEETDTETLLKIKSELGIHKDDFVIGAVGRVYNQVKRFSDIIEAILLVDNPKIKLILIGQGPDLEHLKELASSLCIQDQVIFLGYQANPHIYYSLMNIFCVPSLQEGFGMVAVEAMMHKLPLIATRVGGLKDIVVNNETGFLINPKSSIELAAKIRIFLDTPEEIGKMGSKGYDRAIQNYSTDKYVENLENLYLLKIKDKNISIK